jgi:Family of unknown function (DUF5681)
MSQSDPPDGTVGYGRLPVNRQFKPGQSGNPKGRPKGRKNLVTTIAAALSETIPVRGKNGRIRRLTKLEAMFGVMINKALAGDHKALVIITQLADKLGVFKVQAQGSSAAGIRADLDERVAELSQRMAAYNRQPSEESKSTTQQETHNEAPAQPGPKIK